MGEFHIATNYLALLWKKYEMSEIEDIPVESDTYGYSKTAIILKGKSHIIEVRAHMLWRLFSGSSGVPI